MPRKGTPARMRSTSVSRTPQRIEGAHHLAEMAHAGEEDFGGRAQARGIANQRVLAAEFAERVLHAAQVAGAVVEDGDHKQPLGGGQLIFEARVFGAGVLHGARETFEDGFDLVMVGAAVQHLGVQVGAGVIDEAAEEIFDQFGLQIAHQAHLDQVFVDQRGASAEIDARPRRAFRPWAGRSSRRG